ncbi:uncharacterized protein LOC134473830 isoform X1 [Cavia porcellus]|uniref:uncharacterized protein LOC134473830 isoform X1 n=1 Tax=Cavia porcellus TaxID=10141 RepID=UPI002FE3DA74
MSQWQKPPAVPALHLVGKEFQMLHLAVRPALLRKLQVEQAQVLQVEIQHWWQQGLQLQGEKRSPTMHVPSQGQISPPTAKTAMCTNTVPASPLRLHPTVTAECLDIPGSLSIWKLCCVPRHTSPHRPTGLYICPLTLHPTVTAECLNIPGSLSIWKLCYVPRHTSPHRPTGLYICPLTLHPTVTAECLDIPGSLSIWKLCCVPRHTSPHRPTGLYICPPYLEAPP